MAAIGQKGLPELRAPGERFPGAFQQFDDRHSRIDLVAEHAIGRAGENPDVKSVGGGSVGDRNSIAHDAGGAEIADE